MKLFLALIGVVFLMNGCSVQEDPAAAETAIQMLLEKESATWRSGDIQGHAECWHIRPYSKILVSTGDGTVLDIPPSVMINPPPGTAGQGGTSVNSNYQMNIQGDFAWVSHDEVSTSREGAMTYSKEIRLLEKIEGKWKLVGQSIHIDNRKPETSETQ